MSTLQNKVSCKKKVVEQKPDLGRWTAKLATSSIKGGTTLRKEGYEYEKKIGFVDSILLC